MRSTIRALGLSLAVLALAGTTAQGIDVEPNNTCETAQDLGTVTLPFVFEGSLEPTPDVDFLLLAGPPGETVSIDHEGASTGAGTLPDPLLAVLDTNCQLIAQNDDTGSLNSRVIVTLPADGRIVVAATAFPDFELLGGGEGSYRVTVAPFLIVGAIHGRLVDAVTGEPLPGTVEPWSWLELFRCGDAGCFEYVNAIPANLDGTFRFVTDGAGNPLAVGTYQVRAYASLHETFTSPPFAVGEGEEVDLGDLPLEPFRFVGSISGRVVDGVTGDGLPGDGPPFAYVLIERCLESRCVSQYYATPDHEGRFRVGLPETGLRVGTYRLAAYADQHLPATSERVAVGEGEDFDFGELRLEPFPITFGEVVPCSIPTTGGPCRYGVELTNRLATERFDGQVWSLVNAYGTGSFTDSTSFQAGRLGTVNPMPEKLNLKPGESVFLELEFDVPASVEDGAFFCTTAFVGQEPDALYNVLGERFLFCVEKQAGGFAAVDEKSARRRLRELRQGDARP